MKNNSNLEFRKIKSLDYLYEVNENGTIFRNVKSKKQNKITLDTHHSKKGYYKTMVYFKGKTKRVMIHIVVAECWLGDKPEGMGVDHIDKNSHNNHYTNLRYATHSEQMKNRKLSDRIIKQATLNCLKYTMTYVAKPVIITKDNKSIKFDSMSQAADYISKEYNLKKEHIRSKFKKRRKKIYDNNIKYLRNVETRHADSTE
jgi:hypothetical protein